jgi:lysozyme family protein
MRANFERALANVLVHEGGFVHHPRDPGGATNKGITLATYRAWIDKNGTVSDLKRISADQVARIYRLGYWNAVRGDDLPGGVDYAVFDYGVNSGPGRAVKALQGILGVKQDGIVGPITLAAAKAADAVETIKRLCDQRMTFLSGLGTWDTFGKGWAKRVAGVREDALQLASQPAQAPEEPPPAVPTPPEPFPPRVDEPAGQARVGIVGLIVLALIIVAAVAAYLYLGG